MSLCEIAVRDNVMHGKILPSSVRKNAIEQLKKFILRAKLCLSVCGNAFEPLETFVKSSSVCMCVGTLLST